MKRVLKGLGIAAALAALAAAIPVFYVETRCFDSRPRVSSDYRSILPEPERRALADTFLTYPEWSIVHAYEDLAAVSRRSGEAAFDYTGSIHRYWTSLCALGAEASARGPVTSDVKAMLYIIGLSFSAELGVKGFYEMTIGRLSRASVTGAATPEDRFAHDLADDYAAFLRQTPWYEYPFGAKLGQFWREVPFGSEATIRAIERRIALSLEWGGKSLYAQLMALAAGLSPAKLTLQSVVSDFDTPDATPSGPIRVIERRADGSTVIETPRYRAFTAILLDQLGRGRRFVEIAGNDHIFVTVLVPEGWPGSNAPGMTLVAVPLQARAGWQRRGIYLPLSALGGLLHELRAASGEFEHAYDY